MKVQYIDIDERQQMATPAFGRVFNSYMTRVNYDKGQGATLQFLSNGMSEPERTIFIPEHRILEVGYQ